MKISSSIKSRFRDGRIHRLLLTSRAKAAIAEWEAAGRLMPPPPAYKHLIICTTAARYGTRTFVETGTAWGSTIAASIGTFETIHSIELSDEFYTAACARFRRFRHIHLWHGDSVDQLPRVLEQIAAPALFWLDAHYSGEGTARADTDTPIAAELRTISRHAVKNHVILIDDARCFTGSNGYPSIDWVREFVAQHWPSYRFICEDDIIRITPQ